VTLTLLSRWFDWRSALLGVRPETLIGWHRGGYRLWWQRKSRDGRPPIPQELRELIRRMARENPAWGQERIANELLLKLGLRVPPRTVASTFHPLQDSPAEINDGQPSFAIMPGSSSRVIFVLL
jgi:hypothetical protein